MEHKFICTLTFIYDINIVLNVNLYFYFHKWRAVIFSSNIFNNRRQRFSFQFFFMSNRKCDMTIPTYRHINFFGGKSIFMMFVVLGISALLRSLWRHKVNIKHVWRDSSILREFKKVLPPKSFPCTPSGRRTTTRF